VEPAAGGAHDLAADDVGPGHHGTEARKEYDVRMPSGWLTVTWSAPATGPAKVTRPRAAARTDVPGTVAYSMPRLPGSHGAGGGRNGSVTGASTGGE
jgi:hypothetical protein